MVVSKVCLITVLVLVVGTDPTSASVDCSKAWMHPTPECEADVRIGRLEKLLQAAEANQAALAQKTEAKMSDLSTKLKQAETRITTQSTKLKQAEAKIFNLKGLTGKHSNQLSAFKNSFARKSQLSQRPPGTFSAYLNGQRKYSQRQKVIFPSTIYNTGSYSTSTGIFTAPVSAVYVFNLNLVGCYGGYAWGSVRIMKGSTCLGYIGMGVNHYKRQRATGSGTIVVNVRRGEQVWVKAWSYNGKGRCFQGHPNLGYIYFSGYPI